MRYDTEILSLQQMKKLYIILLAGLLGTHVCAQENHRMPTAKAQTPDTAQVTTHMAQPLVQPHTGGTYAQPVVSGYLPAYTQAETDSLHLPVLNGSGQVLPLNRYPYRWTGHHHWNLHKGLNLNLGASVFAFFGKNAPGGAGFTQSLSAMYAMPLSKNLSLAVGGYLNNMIWSRHSYRDAGVSAVLGYRFNEHWEAYLYGQKSIAKTGFIPYPLYDIGALGDRIGAAVKYHFNPHFSVQLSVEQGWMPKQNGRYFDQYNYPVPRL